MNSEVTWLSEKQQRVWRQWLTVQTQLPAALHRDLQRDSDLSLQDFDVLVHLTESPEGRVRVTELARILQWDRSRLSHHVTRMQRRGLVTREECPDDRRGAFVVVTPGGRTAIKYAAPGHVRTVRELMFDLLTDEELDCLARITEKMQDRLGALESV